MFWFFRKQRRIQQKPKRKKSPKIIQMKKICEDSDTDIIIYKEDQEHVIIGKYISEVEDN
jgi:hypothetical protein